MKQQRDLRGRWAGQQRASGAVTLEDSLGVGLDHSGWDLTAEQRALLEEAMGDEDPTFDPDGPHLDVEPPAERLPLADVA